MPFDFGRISPKSVYLILVVGCEAWKSLDAGQQVTSPNYEYEDTERRSQKPHDDVCIYHYELRSLEIFGLLTLRAPKDCPYSLRNMSMALISIRVSIYAQGP